MMLPVLMQARAWAAPCLWMAVPREGLAQSSEGRGGLFGGWAAPWLLAAEGVQVPPQEWSQRAIPPRPWEVEMTAEAGRGRGGRRGEGAEASWASWGRQ